MENEKLWLDVLAGKAAPVDAATSQAASLRRYYERQTANELNYEPDPEMQKRLMNALRARGAFAATESAPPRPGVIARMVAWLFPAEGGHAGRHIALAAVAFAAVLVPALIQRQQEGVVDDGHSMKSLPDLPASAPVAGERSIRIAQPEQEAKQLVDALSKAGVAATLTQEGESLVVRAQIPAQRAAAAKAELEKIRMAAPDDGVLVVRYETLQ